MIYIVAILLALVVVGGGVATYTAHERNAAIAEYKQKVDEKEQELQAQAEKAKQEEANKISDMQSAYEAGQEKAKTVYVQVRQRGASDVANYPVFSNRACDWPDDSVRLVRSAFASLRAPSDTGIAPARVPAAATAPIGTAGGGVPMGSGSAGTVEPVHPNAQSVGGSGQVSGTGTTKPPKPKPIGRQQ